MHCTSCVEGGELRERGQMHCTSCLESRGNRAESRECGQI